MEKKELAIFGLAIGLSTLGMAYQIAMGMRNPVPVPQTYCRISPAQMSMYENKNVEMEGKLVSLKYEDMTLGETFPVLKMELKVNDTVVKARSTDRIMIDFSRCRRTNIVSEEKLREVYGTLKSGVSLGNTDSIVLRGRVDDGSLTTYAVNIKGKDYILLNYEGK
jgi:hypothetical protein